MARFDSPHFPNDSQGDRQPADPLLAALQDVEIPDGLEARLLAVVGSSGLEATVDASDLLGDVDEAAEIPRHQRWSRRRVLSAGLAAGLGSIIAGGSAFAWSRRSLGVAKVVRSVNTSLGEEDWVAWTKLPVKVTFPRKLRKSLGWQARKMDFGCSAVAFNMSLPGCPKAVLFAIKTPRDLAAFAKTPPPTPQFSRTGVWSHFAVWQDANLGVLYVLAIQSDEVTIKRDYPRLFRAGPTAPLA